MPGLLITTLGIIFLILLCILFLPWIIKRMLMNDSLPLPIRQILFVIGYLFLSLYPSQEKIGYQVSADNEVLFHGKYNDSSLIKCLYLSGYYEPSVVSILIDNLKPNDIFIDIGANEGFFSLIAANLGANVLAIEASPRNTVILEHNSRINHTRHKIDIKQVAAHSSNEELTFHDNMFNRMWSSVQPGGLNFMSKPYKVQGCMVDDLIPKGMWKNIKVIKIDVEGHEYDVLLGMSKLRSYLKNKGNMLWIIEGYYSDEKFQRIMSDFSSDGYQMTAIPIDSISFGQVYKETNDIGRGQYNFIFRKL